MKNKQILNFHFSNILSFIGYMFIGFCFSSYLSIFFGDYLEYRNSIPLSNAILGLYLIIIPSFFVSLYLRDKYVLIKSKNNLLISLGATKNTLNDSWLKAIVITSIIMFASSSIPLFYSSNMEIKPVYIFSSILLLILMSYIVYAKKALSLLSTCIYILIIILGILFGSYVKALLYGYYINNKHLELDLLSKVTTKLDSIYSIFKIIDKYQYVIMLSFTIVAYYCYKKHKITLKNTLGGN